MAASQRGKGRKAAFTVRASALQKPAKGVSFYAKDRFEADITTMPEQLVCPSQEIIQWVADTMRDQQQDSIDKKEAFYNQLIHRLKE